MFQERWPIGPNHSNKWTYVKESSDTKSIFIEINFPKWIYFKIDGQADPTTASSRLGTSISLEPGANHVLKWLKGGGKNFVEPRANHD